MSKVGCIISAHYAPCEPSYGVSGFEVSAICFVPHGARIGSSPDPSDWPQPGIWSAMVQWPQELPSITVEQISHASDLLSELAGACSLVMMGARGIRPVQELNSYIERVQKAYNDNRLLLRDATWVAETAKTTAVEEQCGDVVMATMHAAVLQKACNIARWQDTFDSLKDYREFLTQKPQVSLLNLPDTTELINMAVVPLRLMSESKLAQNLLVTPKGAAVHSPDFRSVRWHGTEYSFTGNQAACVKVLWDAWQNGASDVGDEMLLNAVDAASPPRSLRDVFRDHPAWGTMIVAGGSKGSHRLAEPKSL